MNRCLITEDKESEIANKMANIIAVKSGHQEDGKIKVLLDSLKQENIANYIKATFGDSVIYMA